MKGDFKMTTTNNLKDLYSYTGIIYDMGITVLKSSSSDGYYPAFYILTDKMELITVPLIHGFELGIVCKYLEHLNTLVHINFENYEQFGALIRRVFRVYASRYGAVLGFDSKLLETHLKALKGYHSVKEIAEKAGIHRSTVDSLRRGETLRPHFHTACRLMSAIYFLEHKQIVY